MPITLRASLVFVTVALCFSGNWIVGKWSVTMIPPLELSTIRFGLAGLLMLCIARATRAPLGLNRWPLLLVAAACGIFGYNALVFVGLTHAPASDGALIVPTLNPLMTLAFATVVGERLTVLKIVGFALATVGAAVVIAGAQSGAAMSSERLVGDLLMVAGAAGWSIYAVIGAVTTRHGSPLGVTAVGCLFGAVMFFPLGFLEHGYRDIPSWTTSAWLAIGYLVVFVTTLGFVLFYWSVQNFGAGHAVLISYLVPIFVLVQAYFFLDERPSQIQLIGGAIILIGLRLATTRRTEQPVDSGTP
jgi:drug/metabolite transporter (DMT)-like permease